MIKNYFKIALRGFRKHKLFTLINIVGLSIGISAALVIYLIVNFDFTFDKQYPNSDRIYRVVSDFRFSGEVSHSSGVSSPLPDAVQEQVTGLEVSAPVYNYYSFTAAIPDGSKKSVKFKNQQKVAFTDNRYFKLFSYTWLSGSAKTAFGAPLQVVLTAKQAKLYFPSLSYEQMVGRTVIYADSIKTTVTGIVQNPQANTDLDFSDFISISTISTNADLKNDIGGWSNTSSAYQFFVKLAVNSKVNNIEGQLNSLLSKQLEENVSVRPEDKGDISTLRLQPLADVHFNADYARYNKPVANKTALQGLIAIAIFIMLLGCVNFINLTTAQATQRAKEIGIRKTMGSSRTQLIFQFLSETLLITVLAIIISVVFAPYILKLFADFVPPSVKIDLINQPDIIIFLLLLAVVITSLSGFYPAVILSAYQPVQVLKNQALNNINKTRSSVLRKTLTVGQFAIAQFFIMATLLVSKQIYYALHKDLGFKKDAIVYFRIPYNNRNGNGRQVMMDKLRALPAIENVGLGAEPPSSYNTNTTSAIYNDGKNELKTQVQRKIGNPDYINIYKIRLIAGRNLGAADTLRSVLINKNYARLLGFKNVKDALGKTLRIDGRNLLIIGLVADFRQASLHEPFKPIVILSDTYNYSTFHIALKQQTAGGNEWAAATAGMEKVWKQTYPEDDFQYNFFDESIARFYKAEQNTGKLLTWATGLSIFISCLGLLGLAIYTTNQRTKEIGVRKVLGASVTQIVTLLSAELIWLTILAFALVTPLAYYAMHKWMESFADRTAISWWIFAASGAGMLTAALFTLSLQTVKAAIANPVLSLRSE